MTPGALPQLRSRHAPRRRAARHHRAPRRPHNRGAVYLAVLGTSMIVAMIGISALLAHRAFQRTSESTHRATEAHYLAHAAVELALLRINNDPDWRTTHTAGQWTPFQSLDPGSFRYRLQPTQGTHLHTDPDAHVWLEAEGRADHAVRLIRVALQPTRQIRPPNRIRNHDFAQGSRHWQGIHPHDRLEYTRATAHRGQGSLRIYNTVGAQPRLSQTLTSRLDPGRTYHLRAAMRTVQGSRNIQFRILADDNLIASQSFPTVDTTWQVYTATLTPTWNDPDAVITFEFRSDSDNHSNVHLRGFLVDDVAITPADNAHHMTPVPATWQQQVR